MLGYGALIVVNVMFLPKGLVTLRDRFFPRPQET
jgi:ABC-type branched-subunit amino acid transport system permease subunit